MYALSHDLVRWIATSPEVAQYPAGKEDIVTPRWLNMHPDRKAMHWVSEHCWIYDHPLADTVYSHGFLFPEEVLRVQAEEQRGLSADEVDARGGRRYAPSWSSVSNWRVRYQPPRPDMSSEERIEALIEGGGRWKDSWYRSNSDNDTAPLRRRDELVLSAADRALPNESVSFNAVSGLAEYPHAPTAPPSSSALLPEPVGPEYAGTAQQLHNQRTSNGRYGGTVVVHFNKKEEWFLQAALTLIGRDRLRDAGAGGAGRNWRMYDSPIAQRYSDHAMAIKSGRRT